MWFGIRLLGLSIHCLLGGRRFKASEKRQEFRKLGVIESNCGHSALLHPGCGVTQQSRQLVSRELCSNPDQRRGELSSLGVTAVARKAALRMEQLFARC